MNAGHLGDYARPSKVSNDAASRFHPPFVAHIATAGKRPVAKQEIAGWLAGCCKRYMLSTWLKEALAAAGKSQAEMSRQLTERLGRSIDRAAVNKMIKGTRAIAGDEMIEIGRITGVDPPMAPEEGAEAIQAPLVGYVGAGGDLVFEAPGVPLGWVPMPKDVPENTVAVEIRGESLGPGFDRWLAYYADRKDAVTADMIGRLCVVGTIDGRQLIKWVRRGPGDSLNLVSGTGAIEEGVEIVWAARVLDMRPKD